MTKEEFIAGYVERSRPGTPSIEATKDGCRARGNEWLALPCHCGEDVCDGWAMIRDDAESIADHLRFHGRAPDEAGEHIQERT